jgi:hypothetical protein
MLGGAFLCYEGTEKVYEALFPHAAHHHEEKLSAAPQDPAVLEEEKIRSAIKTDFILSAEIMAIALATLPTSGFVMQAVVLAAVGLGITVVVYGAVALIVKADDAGVAMAAGRFGPARAFGRGLVSFMPVFLRALSVVGTAAMVWVGGGIILHGIEEYGPPVIGQTVHHWAEAAAHAVPAVGGLMEWAVTAAISGVIGLVVGAILIPVVEHVIAPLARRLRGGTAAAAHQAH